MSLVVRALQAQSLARGGWASSIWRLPRPLFFTRGIRRSLPIQSRAFSHDIRNSLSWKPDNWGPRLSALNQLERTKSSSSQLRCLSSSASEVAKSSAIQEASGRDLVLSPPALVVTREYEWANILVGFEQANKYTIRAAPGGQVVGYLAEEESIGRTITRNVLRTRRPFKATVFDKDRQVLFIIRRPLFLVSSSVLVETPEGDLLGEVHMDWHLWKRRYSLFVDKEQFATVNSGFLAVDFDMRDADGKKIASVNKDFTGFGRELFTDARQYVLRLDPSYGFEHDANLVSDAATVNLGHEEYSEFKVGQRERAVVLGTAIAIDFDYFSLHSRGHMHPGLMAMPGGSATGAPGAGGAGAAVGADVLSDIGTENEGMADSDPEGVPINQDDPYGVPLNDNQQFSDADGGGFAPSENDVSSESQSEWATFEEPDHGFQEDPFPDDNTWSGDGESWSNGAGGVGGDAEEGRGLIGTIMDIFFDND